MAIVNKATLKGFFEQGDIPTQGQYFNLIDSTFNLADTDAQVLQGTISASVGDFEHLKLKKAFIPGIGVGTAKVGTSFVIGSTLEIVGDLNLTNGNVSASGTGVNGSGSFTSLHVQDYGNITSSGTIRANQFFFSDSLNNLLQDGQLSLADADADDISLFAGLNGVDQGQGFIRTDGKGFTLLLDKDNGVTGEFFNIKKNGALPNLGTELLRLDEDGSITFTANVTASAIQASGNITSSGNIKANGNIVGDDSTEITNISTIKLDTVADDASGGDTNIALTNTTLNIEVGGETFLESQGDRLKFHTNVTSSGAISGSNNLIMPRQFDLPGANGMTQGDITYFGSAGTDFASGKLHYLRSNSQWFLADKDAELTSGAVLLAFALGAAPSNGMLLRGMFRYGSDLGSVGDRIYVGDSGVPTNDVSGFATGDFIRIIGYLLGGTNGELWFNPDNTYIEKA